MVLRGQDGVPRIKPGQLMPGKSLACYIITFPGPQHLLCEAGPVTLDTPLARGNGLLLRITVGISHLWDLSYKAGVLDGKEKTLSLKSPTPCLLSFSCCSRVRLQENGKGSSLLFYRLE